MPDCNRNTGIDLALAQDLRGLIDVAVFSTLCSAQTFPIPGPGPGHGSWNVSSQVTKGDFSASFFLAINLVLSGHWLQYTSTA